LAILSRATELSDHGTRPGFGSEARCMVEGESIVKSNARTIPSDNIVMMISPNNLSEMANRLRPAGNTGHDGFSFGASCPVAARLSPIACEQKSG
jgi:hypothetical protein